MDRARAPYRIYSDQELYRIEQDRIFSGPHWNYVGLSAEIPNPGDFKSTAIGEKPVIAIRNREGEIVVVENHCTHRGVKFCQRNFGTVSKLVCPYHQWTFNLDGKLIGVPFKRGVKGRGGMPADFRAEDHGLRRLSVTERNGVVFASFDANVPSFEKYLGKRMLGYYDRTFNGRKLKLLGYSRQRIRANWKLMQENIKDPYHASLLHVFFISFGLFRADQEASVEMDELGRHAVLVSRKSAAQAFDEVTAGVDTFKNALKLNDTGVLDAVEEAFWNGPSVVMQTIFPNLIVQQHINSLATRQILPRGSGAFDLVWTFFGYADDDAEMTRRRLCQANLFGPAGYVSADDGEIVEMSQQGLEQFPEMTTLMELGGREVASTDHMVTETAIRGMHRYYRDVVGR